MLESKLLFIRSTVILNISVRNSNNDADLYHNYKDDKEDKVSVEVGVTVSLLLLVETYLVRKNVTPSERKNVTPREKKMSHRAK